jgi:hypothetical protein
MAMAINQNSDVSQEQNEGVCPGCNSRVAARDGSTVYTRRFEENIHDHRGTPSQQLLVPLIFKVLEI